jgi:glutaredoxin-related protein
MQTIPNTIQTSTSSKICNFFLKGSCTKPNCKFFHGYSENLQHIDIEKIHEKNIVSMCQINDKKFITADDNLIQIWVISAEDKKKCVGQQMFDNEKITKVIFSNEKAIVATQIEQMYDKF